MKSTSFFLVFCFTFSFASGQMLQNTRWKVFNPNLSDTVTVDFKTDTINQYLKADSIVVSSLYWQYTDTVKIVDVGGSLGCTNPDTGYYTFAIVGDSLFITLINDPCLIRGITYDGVVLWRADLFDFIDGDIGREIKFKIYPNPAKAHSSIYVETERSGLLEVYNLYGQKVRAEKQIRAHSKVILSLEAGAYIIRLSTNKKVYTTRLLVD